MSWFSRLMPGRRDGAGPAAEQRGSFQDWVDLVTNPDIFPLLHTTMSALDEEQVTGSLSQVAKTNGPVFALMLARMQVFSQARFQWTRFERGEPGDLFGTAELSVLERPWPGGTTADLLSRMEMDVTGAGNSYIRRVRRTRFGEDRLVRLRPDWVTIIMGSREDAEHPAEAADVELLGYAYMPNGDRADRMVVLEPDEVVHYAPMPDPDAIYAGMSWVTPVIRDVWGDNASTIHKDRFFRNATTPNLAIKFDPSITLAAVKEFKEFMEAGHKGAWNAWKTLYLGGGADPVPLGKDFAQMQFAVTVGKGESRLAAAAGVPPSWVGFSEGLQGSSLNAGNFTAARRRFGDGTMQSLWSNVASSMQTILTPPDPGSSLWFVTRGIPFLNMDAKDAAEVQFQEAQTITALVRDGFTPESVKAAVQNQDWALLVHSGMLSVQLQEPGVEPPPAPNGNGNQEGARAALLGGTA